MTETHELRLKINAAAAKSGAREFKSTINSIQVAVESLDKTASGTFSRFAKDTSGIKSAANETRRLSQEQNSLAKATDTAAARVKQMALSSAAAMRTSQSEAQRLVERFRNLGDTSAIEHVNRELARLKANLTSAQSPLDVRAARSGFADVSTDLRLYANELDASARAQRQAADAERAHVASLDALRAKYNPLYSASKQYEVALEEISRAEREGVLSASVAAQARERAAAGLQVAGAQAQAYAAKANVGTFATANLAAQFNDIGVMLAAGQSPLMLAVQQGTQISQVLTTMGGKATVLQTLRAGFMAFLSPVTLATVGIIAGGAALVQWGLSALTAEDAAEAFKDEMDRLETMSSDLSGTLDVLKMDTIELAEKYGIASEEVRRFAELQARLQIGQIRDALKEQATVLNEAAAAYSTAATGGRTFKNTIEELQATFGITNGRARDLNAILQEMAEARGPDQARASMEKLQTFAAATGLELEKFPGELGEAISKQIDLNQRSRELENIVTVTQGAIAGAVSQTAAWASAMSGVRAEIDAIMASLSTISGGMVANAAKRAELTALQAGKSIQQATQARVRAQAEAEFSAREAGAGSGIGGWLQRQAISMERVQFDEGMRLDTQLDAARTAARKAASSSGGGGGGRVEALGDEERQLKRLIKEMNNRTYALGVENDALQLVASGQASSLDVAKLMVAAQREGAGAIDEQTMAMVRQYEAATTLNEQLQRLAKDPVKEWIKSVPTWREAGQQIETEVLDSLSSAIENFARTGKFSFDDLAASILATATKVMAQRAVKELITAFGGNTSSSGGGSGGFGLGEIFEAFFAAEGGLTSAPANVNRGPIMSPAVFHHAPHYAQGTANTSGIPAMLRDNEAVIPLTKGRKVPVELDDNGHASSFIYSPTYHVSTPDADSFRKSRKQVLNEGLAASQQARRANG